MEIEIGTYMKKYKTDACSWGVPAYIEEVEVERETESSVWIKGRRNAKVTDYAMYFDTWEDAHDYLLKKCDEKIAYAKNQVLGLEDDRKKVWALAAK
jgi:hypothetical protein